MLLEFQLVKNEISDTIVINTIKLNQKFSVEEQVICFDIII